MQMPGFGIQSARKLIHATGTKNAADLFNMPLRDILKVDGIGKSKAVELLKFDDWKKADRVIAKTEDLGATLISYTDPEYPQLLRQIYDPPLLLWVKGNHTVLNLDGLAVVGTRNPGRYGREQAEKWTKKLTEQGLCIISGLAHGVDSVAHRETLKAGGKTVAVLGSGIDWIYPDKNRKLAADICEKGGAVITEYPPGTKPDAGNFPERNRIVSGMSHGVLVVESGVKGGSMITARSALDQNRDVFVIPHPLGYMRGEGCNYLIRTGQGKLVQTVDDITDELPVRMKPGIAKETPKILKWTEMELSGDAKIICELLEESILHIDQLTDKTGTPTYKLLPALLDLEMKGAVRQKAGKYFELC